jgi:hypothetical protein
VTRQKAVLGACAVNDRRVLDSVGPEIQDEAALLVDFLDAPNDAVLAVGVADVQTGISSVDRVQKEHRVARHSAKDTPPPRNLLSLPLTQRDDARARASAPALVFELRLTRGATAGAKADSATPLHSSCQRGRERG